MTAQKRAESLQEVPIAMAAFSGDELERVGVGTAEEILNLVPNALALPQGGAKQNFFIRGVGTADFHLNVVGAVGVFLDGVSLNSPFSVSFNAFDMERAEVLRGPQNTLFGRNTTGGAVNYISRKPDPEQGTNGYLSANIGRFSQLDLEGAIGFALSETAAIRLSATSKTRDGAVDNLTLATEDSEIDRQAGRAQLLWLPTDELELLVSLRVGQSSGDPAPFKNVGLLDPNDLTAACPVPADQIIPANNPNCADSSGFVHQYSDWDSVYGNVRHHEDVDSVGGTVAIVWDTGNVTFTSITAIDELDVEYIEDSDGAPTTIFNFQQEGEYQQWSQEFQLASPDDQPTRWIAGAYYFFEDANYTTAVRRTPAPLAPSGPDMFNIVPNTIVQQDNAALSLFGQLEYDLREDLTLTAGYRWTNEKKDGTNATSVRCVGPNGGPPFCPSMPDDTLLTASVIQSLPDLFLPPAEVLDGEWDEWGARLALDYQASDDLLFFGSISRGFKGGGFSIAALQSLLGLAAQDVEPETLVAYEIGMKSDLPDRGLRINAAVFYYDWEGYQAFQPLVDPMSGLAVPQLLNVPETSLLGGEVEVTWLPTDTLFLQAGLGLLSSEIDEAGNIAGVSNGNDLPNVPELTFTGLVRKEFPIGDNLLALQTNFRYQDDVTYDLANARNLSQDGFWNINARASYYFGDNQQYEITVWGENLSGEEYCRGMTSLGGLSESNICLPSLADPTFGIIGTLRFE